MSDEDPGTAGTTDDDLAARRQARGGSVADAALNGGDEPPVGEEDDGQFFVWEQGRKVTLGNLISRGTTTEHAFVFTGKRLKGSGGMPAFDEDIWLISRCRPAKVAVVPTRDDDEKVVKVVIENQVAPKVLVNAETEEGIELMRQLVAKWDELHAA